MQECLYVQTNQRGYYKEVVIQLHVPVYAYRSVYNNDAVEIASC